MSMKEEKVKENDNAEVKIQTKQKRGRKFHTVLPPETIAELKLDDNRTEIFLNKKRQFDNAGVNINNFFPEVIQENKTKNDFEKACNALTEINIPNDDSYQRIFCPENNLIPQKHRSIIESMEYNIINNYIEKTYNMDEDFQSNLFNVEAKVFNEILQNYLLIHGSEFIKNNIEHMENGKVYKLLEDLFLKSKIISIDHIGRIPKNFIEDRNDNNNSLIAFKKIFDKITTNHLIDIFKKEELIEQINIIKEDKVISKYFHGIIKNTTNYIMRNSREKFLMDSFSILRKCKDIREYKRKFEESINSIIDKINRTIHITEEENSKIKQLIVSELIKEKLIKEESIEDNKIEIALMQLIQYSIARKEFVLIMNSLNIIGFSNKVVDINKLLSLPLIKEIEKILSEKQKYLEILRENLYNLVLIFNGLGNNANTWKNSNRVKHDPDGKKEKTFLRNMYVNVSVKDEKNKLDKLFTPKSDKVKQQEEENIRENIQKDKNRKIGSNKKMETIDEDKTTTITNEEKNSKINKLKKEEINLKQQDEVNLKKEEIIDENKTEDKNYYLLEEEEENKTFESIKEELESNLRNNNISVEEYLHHLLCKFLISIDGNYRYKQGKRK